MMKNKKGFTLIEVIVVSLIAGIIGLGTVNVVANSNRIVIRGARQAAFNSTIHIILNDIGKDIREGYKIFIPGNWGPEIQITKRLNDGSEETVKWSATGSYDIDTGGYIYCPVRTGPDGKQKLYKLMDGGKAAFKQIYPYFSYPDGGNTPYDGFYMGADVYMYNYYSMTWSDYWYSSEKTSYFCRHRGLNL